MPEQKMEAIKKLRHQYGKVAMAGDGVNDAPAITNATVASRWVPRAPTQHSRPKGFHV